MPLVGSLIGRLPLASEGLAILFLVRHVTGSFADAGLVEAFALVGVGIGLPVQGRLVDRLGQPRVLLPSAVLNAASLGLLVIVARGGASLAALAALSALSGLTVPPISSCMRGIWAAVLDDAHALQSAYALDAVIIEVAFITGPLLAAGLTAAVSRERRGAGRRPAHADRHGRVRDLRCVARLAGPGRRDTALGGARCDRRGSGSSPGASAGFGFSNGAMVLALTAFGNSHDAPEIVGPLLSIQAVASMIGGIWFGRSALEGPHRAAVSAVQPRPCPRPGAAHPGAVRGGDGRSDGPRRAGDRPGNRDRVRAGRPDRASGHVHRGVRLGDHGGGPRLGAGRGARPARS